MSDKWLPAAQLTPSGRPILNPGEVECYLISAVDIESASASSPPFKSGLLTLTTHRLIWIHPNNDAVFIPLSLITHIHPLSKSFKSLLSISSPRVRFDVSASHSGRVDPVQGRVLTVTVVMRGKADNHEVFYEKLWAAWRARSSQGHDDHFDGTLSARAEIGTGTTSSSSSNSVAIKVPVVGVSGILRKEQEMWESTDKTLHDAFQDLNALMSKAREMVMLAEKMRQKLLSPPSTTNDDEMGSKEEIQDWLLSVGIISPVTKESAGALYHQQMSRQLADFVKIPLERAGGMINLIDVYCLFNRARGTELISPDDLSQACTLWEKLDVPVMLRKYDSGVMVIQSKSHSDEEVFGRIGMFILKPDSLRTGVSPSDAAITLGIAPAMAKEHLLAAESRGILCRDTSADGLRFFVNIFPDINLDDIYLVNDKGNYALWVASVITS